MSTWGIDHIAVEDEDRGTLYDHSVVVRLMAYLRPHTARVVVAVLSVIVYTGTVVALPWIIKWTIDEYIRTEDLSTVTWAVGAFLLVAALQLAFNYLHLRVGAFVAQQVLYKLRMDLFRHLQGLSMSYFDRSEVGKVMSRIQNDVQQLQEFLFIGVISVADVLSLAGVTAAMFLLSPRLALITLVVVPPMFVVLAVWQYYARGKFLRVRQALAVVNSGLQENISGVRVVQSLNRERTNLRRFQRSNDHHLGANIQATRYLSVLLPSVEVLISVSLALVVFFGGSMVLDRSLEVGVLVAFALYIQRFFDPIRNLTMQYSELQRAMASGARIFQLLDVRPEIVDIEDAAVLPDLRGEISYDNVTFDYGDGNPVLESVDLHVRPGETVALVGPTGAGKTTMASLVLRLYDVTSGRITIDGRDIRDLALQPLVRQMAMVLQEPFLFAGTVLENIRHSHAEASDADVVEAAKSRGRPRLHNQPGEGLRHPAPRARQQPQHGPAPADQLCPGAGGQAENTDTGRGDGQHRRPLGGPDPERAGGAPQGHHRAGDSTPAVHRKERRPDRRAGRRPHRGEGGPSPAHVPGRPLRPAPVLHRRPAIALDPRRTRLRHQRDTHEGSGHRLFRVHRLRAGALPGRTGLLRDSTRPQAGAGQRRGGLGPGDRRHR